jgi:succinate dehydrogenase/fumarate reductase flavoprotein subunit
MWEFYQELQSGNGPVFLKLDHLAEETIQTIEQILHTNERPSRGRFHAGRGTDYRQQMVEMHISEIGFCSGHSASGVYVNARAETTVPGLYAAGDMAAVPHNYMLGAFTYGWFAGQNAADYVAGREHAAVDEQQVAEERARVYAPLERDHGHAPSQVEYKLRRMVNDYLQPPKVTRKMEIGLQRFAEIADDIDSMRALNPHELMRAAEVRAIRDCAEMAARASLFRTESRWGLYHHRVDYPQRDDAEWFCHTHLRKDEHGRMTSEKRAVEPYVVPLADDERSAYQKLRIRESAALAAAV